MYHYDDFESKTILKTEFIGSKNMLIIGNKNDSYITSYINDSNASFEAIQNRFPIVMIDENNNEWNVFGQAVSGPRKGEQLDSQVGFFALFSAWEDFYDEFTFD